MMGRLIDADALKETMRFHVTTMSVCSTTIEARAKTDMKTQCISDVESAPTVDAIPVEWIENKREEWRENGAPRQVLGAVKALLVQWQKEQEGENG